MCRLGGGNDSTREAEVEMRVWVYYNPAASEAIIYENEPPPHFGRRQYDIGPIEIEDEQIHKYGMAKVAWREAHNQFVEAVRAAQASELIDWANADSGP
jgi:hypothetical protein